MPGEMDSQTRNCGYRIPVGVAYAICSGGGIVLVALVAWAMYGQRPDAAGVGGSR